MEHFVCRYHLCLTNYVIVRFIEYLLNIRQWNGSPSLHNCQRLMLGHAHMLRKKSEQLSWREGKSHVPWPFIAFFPGIGKCHSTRDDKVLLNLQLLSFLPLVTWYSTGRHSSTFSLTWKSISLQILITISMYFLLTQYLSYAEMSVPFWLPVSFFPLSSHSHPPGGLLPRLWEVAPVATETSGLLPGTGMYYVLCILCEQVLRHQIARSFEGNRYEYRSSFKFPAVKSRYWWGPNTVFLAVIFFLPFHSILTYACEFKPPSVC